MQTLEEVKEGLQRHNEKLPEHIWSEDILFVFEEEISYTDLVCEIGCYPNAIPENIYIQCGYDETTVLEKIKEADEEYLLRVNNLLFRIKHDKEARRSQYLELHQEFGDIN